MQARIATRLERGQTYPLYTVNMTLQNSYEDKEYVIDVFEDTVESIKIDWQNKPREETVLANGEIIRDQTIEITDVWIENIILEKPILEQLGMYTPNYREDFIKYCDSNSIPLDNNPHKLKFWHAGTWRIKTPYNFWEVYSQKINQIDDSMDQHTAKQTLGIWDAEISQQVAILKKCINDAQ